LSVLDDIQTPLLTNRCRCAGNVSLRPVVETMLNRLAAAGVLRHQRRSVENPSAFLFYYLTPACRMPNNRVQLYQSRM